MRKLTKNKFEDIKPYIKIITEQPPPITLAVAS